MKLSRIASGSAAADLLTKDVELVLGATADDIIHATVRPLGLTEPTKAAFEAMSTSAAEDHDEAAAKLVLAAALSELVKSWDLEGEDGTVELTVDSLVAVLDALQLMVLVKLTMEAIHSDPFGSSKSSKRSTKPVAKPRRRS